jgi:replicative DNA helicase
MGKVATPVTLKTFLPAETDIGGMTVGQYLARVAAKATTIINAQDYGRTIYDMALRRNPDRPGHGQYRLRCGGGFCAARADRGCRTQIV